MRRSRRLRLVDLPRLLVGGVVGLAGLFGGKYRRIEGAHVMVTDDAGHVLVVRTTYLGPEWMLPGGRVERGETPHAAAARETLEETGLRVRIERLAVVDAHRARDVSFVFVGRVEGGDLEPQLGEIAEAGWVGREEIERMSPRLHRLLGWIERAGEGVAYVGLPSR
ncbi:MAG TPA: NUDIX hydrolase [Candidatus Limnocylindria bacterium]